jgi:glyoxylate carboligase
MSQTVAGTLVDVLEKVGVRHIFGLIGDSLNSLADAVRHSKIEWIGVRHEEGAALAAAGQAKLTGRLSVCCGYLANFTSPCACDHHHRTRREAMGATSRIVGAVMIRLAVIACGLT